MKTLYLLCGGNGAGKTTFYRQHLRPEGIQFVNADEIAKQFNHLDPQARDSLAWKQAIERRDRKLARGETFAYETVFSHPSKLELINEAQRLGYVVNLFFIWLRDPLLHEVRVKHGAEVGERHDVPTAKIYERLPRTQQYVAQALKIADASAVLDNSSASEPFKLIGRFTRGTPEAEPAVPAWLHSLLAD